MTDMVTIIVGNNNEADVISGANYKNLPLQPGTDYK